ncbi:RpiB/LacA/LacB family sugar-phosphate isomerase [Arthrobacter globiformis]|uniref:RpiB/LacA/LacB family sugar-phosphate isomerase n=1 Tax=Arthrobacter globiformis TaxID=1665 RepID=UPI00167D5848
MRAGLTCSRFAVEISRGNNEANVMVLGSKVLGDDQALALAELCLETRFRGRVARRRRGDDQRTRMELEAAPE